MQASSSNSNRSSLSKLKEEFSHNPNHNPAVKLRDRPENIFFRRFFEQVAQGESVPAWIFRLIFCCRCRGRLGSRGHFERFTRGDIREDLPIFDEMRRLCEFVEQRDRRNPPGHKTREKVWLIEEFMSKLGGNQYEKKKTLMGPAIVYSSHFPSFEMSQEEARRLCGIDRHGRKQQEPSYKEIPFYPVSEERSVTRFKCEYIAHPFAAVLCPNEDFGERLILIIRNLWIENPLPSGYENDHLYQRYVKECKDNPKIPLDDVFSSGEIRRYPFLYEKQTRILQTSPNAQSLQDFLQKKEEIVSLSQESVTVQLLLAILLRVRNGHSSHYTVKTVDPRGKKKLELRNVDSLWNPYVLPGGEKPRLGVYSIVFFLPHMELPADSKVCQYLKEKPLTALLIEWASKLQNPANLAKLIRFKNDPAIGSDHLREPRGEERAFENFALMHSEDFERLRKQLEQLQDLLKRKEKAPTLWDIVEELAPGLAAIYRFASDKSALHWEEQFASQLAETSKNQEGGQHISELVEPLLQMLPLASLEPSEEKALLPKIFNTFENIHLRASRITDEELEAYASSRKARTLTLENCRLRKDNDYKEGITLRGLFKSMQTLSELSTIGLLPDSGAPDGMSLSEGMNLLTRHGESPFGRFTITNSSLAPATESSQVRQAIMNPNSSMAASSSLQIGSPIARSSRLSFPEFAYGREAWESIGDIGEVPPPPADTCEIWESRCPLNIGKKVKDTHVLFFMPPKIKLKGESRARLLTLKTLSEFIHFEKCDPDLEGSEKVEPRWVLLTKEYNHLDYPYDMTEDHKEYPRKKLLEGLVREKGIVYDTPSPLEVVVGMLLDHIKTGKNFGEKRYFICKSKNKHEECIHVGRYDNISYIDTNYDSSRGGNRNDVYRFSSKKIKVGYHDSLYYAGLLGREPGDLAGIGRHGASIRRFPKQSSR